jgi:hypothetical protein
VIAVAVQQVAAEIGLLDIADLSVIDVAELDPFQRYVGDDALGLDGAAVWSEIQGGGDLQPSAPLFIGMMVCTEPLPKLG